jgi:hypothetical protein
MGEETDFSDNDDSTNQDHFAHALIDGNGNVLDFQDGFRFNIESPGAIHLESPLAGIAARPVYMHLFDKATSSPTPGANGLEKVQYAHSNYVKIFSGDTELVDLGLTECASVPYPFCPEPLVFLDGMENVDCGLDTQDFADFTAPLASNELCLPTGSLNSPIGTIQYCQGSCGDGTGCEVNVTTESRVNISQDRYCADYQVSIPGLDIDSVPEDCILVMEGSFNLQASWAGTYTASRTWGYTTHSLDILGLQFETTDENCALLSGLVLDLVSDIVKPLVESEIQKVFIDFFAENAGAEFCPVNSLHPQFIP